MTRADPRQSEFLPVFELVEKEAMRFLGELEQRPVRLPNAEEIARSFEGALSEDGEGAIAALSELVQRGKDAWIGSAGPRYFHFVIGGGTPAAVGADWLASVYDQLASAWVTSPLAVQLELQSVAWLCDLFGLPSDFAGVLTTGAMMANFTCLGAARQWWGEQRGVDIAEQGLNGLPAIPVFSSGFVHATCYKSLAMLGVGRCAIRSFSRDASGAIDLPALEAALRDSDGPAIVIANAGEVNAGAFDPIQDMAELAEKHGSWLHVDGAFGAFAATTPRTRHLTAGIERAHSVTSDGHKWLNVPYDCGFSFVRDVGLLERSFRVTADYLPKQGEGPMLANRCAEGSRRARSLAVWATLYAYGKGGVRRIVERGLELAALLQERVDAESELERLAEVPLNIVCFRYRRAGLSESELDRLNTRLGRLLLEDGRFHAGTTVYAGKVALRPAFVNWRTEPRDVEQFVRVVCELGQRVAV